MKPNFNVRVYAIVFNEHHEVMVLKEPFMGKLINKFPGGGMEQGEGARDTLIREFKEELNLEVTKIAHFYTQDFHQASAKNPEEQLLMLYYEVKVADLNQLEILDKDIESIQWISLTEDVRFLTLETDIVVWKMLQI